MDPRRRLFLRGRVAQVVQDAPPVRPRPPWARPEAEFLQRCTRCLACVPACPERVLRAGDGGLPEVTFRDGACTFCGLCEAACQPKALQRVDGEAPWRRVAVVASDCLSHRGVECRLCGDACDEAALRFPPRIGAVALPVVNPERCTGCGACVAPCPVSAMAVQPSPSSAPSGEKGTGGSGP